ncbi:MAG TPA: Hpt domain-containing protein [Gammaproteobacteria bacterium]|nr:Hpt domain-containing protein [Gammaproteobacteria bacterium]
MDKNNKNPSCHAQNLDELPADYASKIPVYCREIKTLCLSSTIPGALAESLDQLISNCHKLAGSATSYHLTAISKLTGQIEKAVKTQGQSKDIAAAEKIVNLDKKRVEQGSAVTPRSFTA